MSKKSRERSIIRLILVRILIPAITIGGLWAIIPHWPYILVLAILGFWIVVLLPAIGLFKKK